MPRRKLELVIYRGIRAAAVAVRVHPATVARWIQSGRLAAVKGRAASSGGRRPWLIRRDDLLKAAGFPADPKPAAWLRWKRRR